MKIPLCIPFKFVPYTNNPGIHFDDLWYAQQSRPWQMKNIRYQQKWQSGDTTPIQIESTLQPDDLIVYNWKKEQVKTIVWNKVFETTSTAVWECNVDLSAIAEDVYYLYIKAVLQSDPTVKFESISEPISVKASWPNTMLIKYRHVYNDFGVLWKTGLTMSFRCESSISNKPKFETERTAYVNQTQNVSTLWSSPYRVYDLLIGEAPGVAPWVGDLLNRIFGMTDVIIENRRYQRIVGAKLEERSGDGYPLCGYKLEITDEYPVDSLNFNVDDSGTGLPEAGSQVGKIITAYNIETGWFGAGSDVPVIEVQKQE